GSGSVGDSPGRQSCGFTRQYKIGGKSAAPNPPRPSPTTPPRRPPPTPSAPQRIGYSSQKSWSAVACGGFCPPFGGVVVDGGGCTFTGGSTISCFLWSGGGGRGGGSPVPPGPSPSGSGIGEIVGSARAGKK